MDSSTFLLVVNHTSGTSTNSAGVEVPLYNLQDGTKIYGTPGSRTVGLVGFLGTAGGWSA